MKSLKILVVFVLTYASVSVCYMNTEAQLAPSDRMKKNFYMGAQEGWLYPEYYWMYKELSFNTTIDWGNESDFDVTYQSTYPRWHGGFFDTLRGRATLPPGYSYPDSGLADGYLSSLNFMLDSWKDTISANSMLLRSAKINRPTFGQRSDYQSEYEAPQLTGGSIRPGYGYLIHQIGETYSETWKEENVSGRVCYVIPHAQGRDANNSYIVSGLYEKNEQTNILMRGPYLYSDRKREGQNYKWFVKPRMRIDSNVANDSTNWNKKVVRVDVFNYDSALILSIDIKVENFLDSLHYNGNYLEIYSFISGPNPLLVTGDVLSPAEIDSATYYYTPFDPSRVDYRIYWYGEVDVWLDYVRLDDEWAHFLFTDTADALPLSINPWHFHTKLQQEVETFGNRGGFGYFYLDEYYYNHIPCIKEVLRLVKVYNPNTGIIMVNVPSGGGGVKNEPNVEDLYNQLNQMGIFINFIATDSYRLNDNTPLPANLPKPDSSEFPGTVLYNNAGSNNQYNDHLNTIAFDTGYFRKGYKRAASIIENNSNTVFNATIQAHSVEVNFRARLNEGS